ncbi:nucleotidyltransferase family protein [Thermicanus aegyptius]|uniref:nucleotidyltransferase family protein n=1 Tax=Thermicanus aegyptius TaxID=94009 RepID=UPI0004087756|nr:NDP-sugar synthase [Thermicanus aegyptius]
MQVLLLAGGLGTRLQPLTDDLPKPMALLGNRPWLESLVTHLKASGVQSIVMTVKHFPEIIEQHFGNGERFGVRIVYAKEERLLGTAGAIKNAEPFLEERFIVINADVVHLLDVGAMMERHLDHGGAVTIALTEVDDPSAYGVVSLKENGAIERFVEKPRRDQAPSHFVNAGAYVLEHKVLSYIPIGREVSIEREIFPNLIAQGEGVFGHRIEGYWLDMGTPERYKIAHWDLLDGKFVIPELPPERNAGIRLGHKVRLGKGVRLSPPVMIGDGTVIGDNAVIGPYAVVGANVVVGEGTTLERTIVWNGARVSAHCQIKNSILGDATVMGEGLVISGGVIKRARKKFSKPSLDLPSTDASIAQKAVVQP